MIYILTGAIRTGKTTALLHWISGRQDTDGILSPDNEHGKRYFLLLGPGEKFIMEATKEHPEAERISVGRFFFLKHAFTRANNYLIAVAGRKKHRWLIIDELGKLELKDTGLHRAAKTMIGQHAAANNIHMILVVRDTLLEDIIAHYGLKEYQCIGKEDLKQLG